MIRKEEFNTILDRYLAGEATPGEAAWLESVYLSWNLELRRSFPETELKQLKAEVWGNIIAAAELDTSMHLRSKPVTLWPRIVVAAAMLTVILGSALLLFNKDGKSTTELVVYRNDVVPGKQGATLTLSNGKKIRLANAANGQLAKEAGVLITKSADGKLIYQIEKKSAENRINTISTANGETYELRLPDGSRVWLNAASSLSYATNLSSADNTTGSNRAERRVKLSGEGFFEIARDENHPFIVEAGAQEVEVLGTHFNINSYVDEKTVRTTLVEGSVKISAGKNHQILKPGQQTVNSGGQLILRQADVAMVTDWKNNEFLLDNQTLQSSLRKIARWYDLQVIYGPDVPMNLEIGGGISRDSKLSSVLKLIASTGIVHFRIEDKKLYVDK